LKEIKIKIKQDAKEIMHEYSNIISKLSDLS